MTHKQGQFCYDMKCRHPRPNRPISHCLNQCRTWIESHELLKHLDACHESVAILSGGPKKVHRHKHSTSMMEDVVLQRAVPVHLHQRTLHCIDHTCEIERIEVSQELTLSKSLAFLLQNSCGFSLCGFSDRFQT